MPDFLGNRAPFADPYARGVIAGLTLGGKLGDLVGLYLAGLMGLGYGVRQILNAQRAAGVETDTIIVSGGAARDDMVRQMLAESGGVTVAGVTSQEPVLLGAAMLGAVASGRCTDLDQAMPQISEIGNIYEPDVNSRSWHDRRFKAFEILQQADREIRMSSPPPKGLRSAK